MDTEKFKELFMFGPKSRVKAGDGLKKGRFPFYTSSPTLSKWIDTEQYFDEALVFGTGGLPSIHYVKEPFATSTDCLVAIAKTNKSFNVKFVYYYIFTNIRILEQGFKGAGLKHISKPYIQNLDIPLPDLETQDKIVTILDKAKNLIDKREQTIKMFDELLRATFLDMFGDPGLKKLDDKLGNYILDLSDYHANGSYESLRNIVELKLTPDYALMVRTVDLEKNDFISNVNYISEDAYKALTKSKLYGGEIIINKIGSAGKIYLMPYLKRPVSLGMNAFLLRFKEEISHYYIYYYLTSKFGQQEIQKRVKGAVTKTITKDAVREIPFFKPSLNDQKDFDKIYLKIQKGREKLIISKNQLENLLNGLSQSAFNGELQFNTAVDLEILMENDYVFFKKHADKKTIQLLLDRMDKNILNKIKFYEEELYDKAKMFVFNLLEEKKIEQVYEQERIKLVVK